MMKKNILVWIFYISLFSCHQETNYKSRFTLKSANECINFKIGDNSRNFSSSIQYFTTGDSNYLALANDKYNSIEIYNLDTRKLLKVIGIKIEGPNAFGGITGFLMNRLDTIIVINMMPRLIGIFNGNGEILKKIPFQTDVEGRMFRTVVPHGGSRPFFKDNTIFLAQLYGARESFGILTPEAQKHSNVNFTVNIETGECKTSPLMYPEELINKDVSWSYVSRVLGYNDCFVYHFDGINGLFVTNDHLSFDKVPLETNYKLSFTETYWKYMSSINASLINKLDHDEVRNIYYDPYRECYYLVVRERSLNLDKNTDLAVKIKFPHCFITILDKKLKYLGDVFFPDDTYSFQMMFITHKGLYISEDHVNNPTFSEDYMRFRLFTLEKQ